MASASWFQFSVVRDHPRSRGVYVVYEIGRIPYGGSSPLARGLLLDLLRRSIQVGIIPARAGFTSSRTPSISRRPDHPRSRGVYPGRPERVTHMWGSSPLARGLLASVTALTSQPPDHPRSRGVYGLRLLPCHFGPRIIPARAGFTHRSSSHRTRYRDHPRSRGVYFLLTHAHNSVMGSSPLARGLLSVDRVITTGTGIIPARAGFTPSSISVRTF